MRMPGEQRRTQLLGVASEMFADRGFHKTSMQDLASAAGVTKPVLYQHFASKRALYIEALGREGSHLLADLRSATSSTSLGRERVERGFMAYFHWVTYNPAGFRLLFSATMRNDPEFASIIDQILSDAVDAVVPLIDIKLPTVHRSVIANAIVGLAEATSRRGLADGGVLHDAEELSRWLAEFAWFGLRGIRPEETAATQ